MDVVKLQKIATFREWLTNQDIQFMENVNGHFHIFSTENQRLIAQVWATTEKMMDNPSDRTQQKQYIGMAKIQRTLLDMLNPTAITKGAEQKGNPLTAVREAFLANYEANKGSMLDCTLVVAVHLPTGATDIIVSSYEVEEKMEYYLNSYDHEFRLKTNPKVKVTGFMLV